MCSEIINDNKRWQELDAADPLKSYRDQFHIPMQSSGEEYVYMTGNSLGLQPKAVRQYIEQELLDWENLGVEGHFHAKHPWMPYHEFLTDSMAKVVGAKPIEVVIMNTLTTNLHLLMVSFYRPTTNRHKILIERDAFPSDKYAVESQIKFHNYDPNESLLEIHPRAGEECIRKEDVLQYIEEHGKDIALIMLGGVNYYTGQLYDLKAITTSGHKQGCVVGFDLAHAAGNVNLQLHDSNADFAAWCTYKYLNAGPGSLGGCFVHERHAHNKELPRFTGWWGHNKDTRFNMRHDFDPMPGAEGWQLSNPPILSLAAIRASLDIFSKVGMEALVKKSRLLTQYMEEQLVTISGNKIQVITPSANEERGCQLSIQVRNADKKIFDVITEKGVIADWREPDVIRVAPVPLYNSFRDVNRFVNILRNSIDG